MTTKILSLKDVAILSMTANMGIRWIAVAAAIGLPSLLFWFLGALLFFIPLSLIVAELSSKYPKEGGMYVWVHQGLGEGPAFIVSWLYWLTNLFYYPAILTFFISVFAYAIKRPDLAKDQHFVSIAVIIVFWCLTLLLTRGMKVSKYLGELGGIVGTLIPFAVLIVAGFAALFIFHGSATPFTVQGLLPDHNLFNNLSSLTMLMFALSGIEVIPTFANAVKDPKRTLPLGILIGAIATFICYVLATLSMNFLISPEHIQKTTGLMAAFEVIGQKFGLPWFAQMMAGMVTFAELSVFSVWLIAPAVMFFKSTRKGVLPEWLHKENKYEMPSNALFLQGMIVTAIIFLTSLLPSVNAMYQVLVLMSTIVYFIPYFILVISYFKLRSRSATVQGGFDVPFGKKGAKIAGCLVLFSLSLGIALGFQLPPDVVTFAQKFTYEAELIGGPIFLVVFGIVLFYFKGRSSQKQ